ncbi:signal recognition particle 9 kDa protein-domain-containing protein [Aspergillus multicolor]|uniref:SRP9/SRP21 family protein n=1 Tax=Aspergillus multicolor TaxID=41759 RepID=UPI003CCE2EE2
MTSGPYLSTSAAYLKESSLLLQAYPNSTRITTKYTFSKSSPSTSSQKSKAESTPSTQPSTPVAPIANLVLKTYNSESGICLKYRTNKAAEVGRLITALGLLAGGADMASLNGPVAAAGGDVEMTGTGQGEEVAATTSAPAPASAGANTGAGVGKGKGKGKKKGKK